MIIVKPKEAPETLLQVVPIERKRNLCLCKTIEPILITVRLLGLCPITWEHENYQCTYKKSLLWTFYTFFISCFYIFVVASAVNFEKITNSKCLIIILSEVTNAINGFYIILLLFVAYLRFPKWIAAFTRLSKALQNGLYCQSARTISIKTQYGYIVLFFVILLVRIAILVGLHVSRSYQISFNYTDFLYRGIQDMAYAFQTQFIGFIIFISGTLACFEKLTKNLLRYTSMHPTKNIDASNFSTDFLGVVNFKLCKGTHVASGKIVRETPTYKIEYLRILHEELSLCIYAFNDAMNPQFLLHTVVELTVLIIHWYAVVAYFVYTFKDPAAPAIHVINCYYVFVHSSGLFLFLKNAQLIKNLVSYFI